MSGQVGPDTMLVKGVRHTATGACTDEVGAWGPFIDCAQGGSKPLFSKQKQRLACMLTGVYDVGHDRKEVILGVTSRHAA
jgi:hypothetical protein